MPISFHNFLCFRSRSEHYGERPQLRAADKFQQAVASSPAGVSGADLLGQQHRFCAHRPALHLLQSAAAQLSEGSSFSSDGGSSCEAQYDAVTQQRACDTAPLGRPGGGERTQSARAFRNPWYRLVIHRPAAAEPPLARKCLLRNSLG